jgi:phosphonate transport system permease protein
VSLVADRAVALTPAPPRLRAARWGGGVGLAVVLLWAVQGANVAPSDLQAADPRGARALAGLLRPDLDPALLAEVARAAVQTLQMAVAGLLFAALAAGPLALLLTGNAAAPVLLRGLARGAAAVLRGVPEVVWALVLVTVVGLGPTAGTLALAVHGAGLLGKLWAEQLDAVDRRPVEAVQLAGAGRAAVLALAVLPQARPGLLSLLLYQLECNVRAAAVLGVVGAGGIGQAIELSLRLFDYGRLATLLLAVLLLVLGVDAVSRILRRRGGAPRGTQA